jgi:hypothetical protein
MRMVAMAAVWFAALASAPAAADETIDVAPAMQAADAWLETLDSGAYGRCWEDAAPVFQESTDRVKWETSIEAARRRLGTLIRRKVRAATHTRLLPGSPPGEYVVIQYETLFENRLVLETVTPVRLGADRWKVSGYLIR